VKKSAQIQVISLYITSGKMDTHVSILLLFLMRQYV